MIFLLRYIFSFTFFELSKNSFLVNFELARFQRYFISLKSYKTNSEKLKKKFSENTKEEEIVSEIDGYVNNVRTNIDNHSKKHQKIVFGCKIDCDRHVMIS